MDWSLLAGSIFLLEAAALIYLVATWQRLWSTPPTHFKWWHR